MVTLSDLIASFLYIYRLKEVTTDNSKHKKSFKVKSMLFKVFCERNFAYKISTENWSFLFTGIYCYVC